MFTLPQDLELGGPSSRYRSNLEALRVLRDLRGRTGPATADEQQVLCRYSGWGDSAVLKCAKRDGYQSYLLREEVASLTTEDEQLSLLASTFNAHYTSLDAVRAIWYGVERLGYSDLSEVRYLDPSAGVGHFLGAAPSWVREKARKPVMVELDKLTAEICGHLYPESEVVQAGFETTYREKRGQRTLSNWFDIAISNVPFGKVKVSDPGMQPRAATESLHNYFITRMLELVRPGGLVVAITSRYTLDGTTSAPVCRRAWAEKAKLELAVRLPCDTFKENAGTEVVTDVLFLRKLREGETGNGSEWVGIQERPISGIKKDWKYVKDQYSSYGSNREVEVGYEVPVSVSSWYSSHSDCVLGKETLSGTMYSNRSYGEKSPDGLAIDLPTIVGKSRDRWQEEQKRAEAGKYNVESDPERGSLTEQMSVCFDRYLSPVVDTTAHVSEVVDTTVLQSEKVFAPEGDLQRRWWDVYLEAKKVIRLQIERCSDEDLENAQGWLRTKYDGACACVGKFGGGASSKEVVAAFRDRPDIHSFLLALENPDGSQAAIFSKRTIFPEVIASVSADPLDAMYRCLDALGRLDLAWVGKSCGKSVIEVIEALGDRIYKDPEDEQWVTTEEYLSGNVRKKLRAARATLKLDDYYQRNVVALERVQPKDLEAQDVSVSLKSPWVPEHILSEFIRDLSGWRGVGVRFVVGSWVLDWDRAIESDRDSDKWRTGRASLGWLLQCGLDGKAPLVYDEAEGDKPGSVRRVLNSEQTVLAQAKLDDIQKEYLRWLWSDETRAHELLEVYNDRFNCFVPRKWDGSFLTFPGQNQEITLRPFQRDGVARVLFADRKNHPALIWPTGAGKTYGGIAAVEKLLQVGLVSKVCICVPRHLVSQWVDDYRRLFPRRADEILCAGKDSLTKKERGVFLSCAATGGYRVVILSHTQLKAIPVRDETFEYVVREQLDTLEREISDQKSLDGDAKSVPLKRLQAMKKSLEARLKDRSERTTKDSSWTVTFEELGFDCFVGDEAQAWKNLQLVTRMGNVSGIRTGSSQIALDFLVKIRHLQRQQRCRIVLATATPVANSLAETYVFASYLQDQQLREQGIDSPDAFFGAFTRTYSSVELEPSCAAYHVVSRLEFGNIPELVYMLRQSWHVVREQDLGLQLPTLATGQEIVVQTPGSEALRRYVQDIADRVNLIRGGKVEPQEDNMLKVCSDGRWASLVNGPPDGEIRDTKLDRVAENVLRHYRETSDERGAQLVFCDLGTPTGERTIVEVDSSDQDLDETLTDAGKVEQTRVYEYIRSLLLSGGIPASEIAFLQDYQGDPQKLRDLYRRVNSGEVRVLLGSAPTGMNVQERLCALHHVDPVWRPDWKTQRDGRIIRQGNRYGVVSIYLYLTEGSFDAYMWGLVKSKLRVIEQVTCGDPTVRKIDGDVGEIVLRASEIQAIASGNPRILTFVGVQNELTKLSALRGEFERNRRGMEFRKQSIPRTIANREGKIRQYRADYEVWERRPQGKGSFMAMVGGVPYDARKEAGEALFGLVRLAKYEAVEVGEYCGFLLFLATFGSRAEVLLSRSGTEGRQYEVPLNNAVGVWSMIENELERIPEKIQRCEREVSDLLRDAESIERELPKPWERGPEYARIYGRYSTLAGELSGVGVSMEEFLKPDPEWVQEVNMARVVEVSSTLPVIRGVQLSFPWAA